MKIPQLAIIVLLFVFLYYRPYYPFPDKPDYIYLNVVLVTLSLSLSTFNYETDHRQSEIALGG